MCTEFLQVLTKSSWSEKKRRASEARSPWRIERERSDSSTSAWRYRSSASEISESGVSWFSSAVTRKLDFSSLIQRARQARISASPRCWPAMRNVVS